MDEQQITVFVQQGVGWLTHAIPNFVAAVLILVVGLFVARWLSRGVASMVASQPRVDQTLGPVVATLARYGVMVIAIIAALSQLGIQTASVLAVLGAAGLAIGLALQGTLSNIAAGLMLLWLRPFRVGESIESGAISGAVVEIGLFATTLRTGEGIFHFVPNSPLWGQPIRNMARNPTRKIELTFSIAYKDDVNVGRETLLALVRADSRVPGGPQPRVVVSGLTDHAAQIKLICWSAAGEHFDVSSDLLERGKAALEKAGLTPPGASPVVHFVTTENAVGGV